MLFDEYSNNSKFCYDQDKVDDYHETVNELNRHLLFSNLQRFFSKEKNIKKDQRQRTYIKVASVSNLILSNNLLQNQIFKKVKATMHAQKDSSCLCRILGNWYHKMSGYLCSIFTIQHQLVCSLSKLEKLDFCDLVAITIIIYLQTQNCLQDDIQILLHAWNTLV